MLLLHPHPSLHPLPLTSYHPYVHFVPSQHASNASLTPLTILMLLQLPQYMPLTLPSPLPNPFCCLPSLRSCCALQKCLQRHPHTGVILNAAYHPYTPAAPSQCDPMAPSPLLPYLLCCLQSLCCCSALKMSL
ncbi:hypothetical protein O181_096673 [Austropuccinia psidii MF-1]|uniref:Uncharacterized protein n=1 Tax=Austropuccinia psidii MF-1 TaxID=1389203 RepID=A0A9Q3J601_9BASI|nr:hypothetical protein [Austropuccinia psidii MF-1]